MIWQQKAKIPFLQMKSIQRITKMFYSILLYILGIIVRYLFLMPDPGKPTRSGWFIGISWNRNFEMWTVSMQKKVVYKFAVTLLLLACRRVKNDFLVMLPTANRAPNGQLDLNLIGLSLTFRGHFSLTPQSISDENHVEKICTCKHWFFF